MQHPVWIRSRDPQTLVDNVRKDRYIVRREEITRRFCPDCGRKLHRIDVRIGRYTTEMIHYCESGHGYWLTNDSKGE